MKQTIRYSARVFAALALALGVAVASVPSFAAEVKVRFTLDWIPQSSHGLFFIALYDGFYKAEGIDVTFDPGKGSADAVRRIVSGAYDMGFPDINALIQYNAKNPDKMIQEVMMGYEQPPFSIFTMKKSNITHPKQPPCRADSRERVCVAVTVYLFRFRFDNYTLAFLHSGCRMMANRCHSRQFLTGSGPV